MAEAAADPDESRRRGQMGRARVEERFGAERMAADMDHVYRELLAAQGLTGRRIAYMASRFPRLSETFVLREANALEHLGWRIMPFSLTSPQPVDWLHAAAQRWRGRVWTPDIWFHLSLAWRHLTAIAVHPEAYVDTLATILRRVGCRRFDVLVRHLAAFALGVGLIPRLRWLCAWHGHFAWVSATAMWAATRIEGLDYSTTVHGSDVQNPRLVDDLLTAKLSEARFIVCVSTPLRDRVRALLTGGASPPIHVVPTGVERRALGEPHGPSAGALGTAHLLSVGRLAPEKGHRHLLAAVRYLRDRTLDVRLEVVGEGAERRRLEHDMARLELGRAVQLRGALSEQQVWERYRRADMFVLPSLREGLGVVLLEAMAAGLPVVASDLPGVREAVEHERSALLVPPGDATALAEAIRRLMGDADLRARLGAAARATIEERFVLEENIQRLAALFEDACGVG
jgi:glycosyltransferase involved in cell wall biosynthesis